MQPIVLLAAAEVDPLPALLQYGVLGVFAIMLIIYTRGSIARERDKSDRAEAKVEELNAYLRTEVLPKQVEATMYYKQVSEVLEEAIQLITEIKIRDSIQRQDPGSSPPTSLGGRRG
jgi:hypothetical protein